jgi:hypothetical protein
MPRIFALNTGFSYVSLVFSKVKFRAIIISVTSNRANQDLDT